jgi:hypothetical protein
VAAGTELAKNCP